MVPQVVPQYAAPPARAATIPVAQPPPPQHTQPQPVVVHLHQSPPQIIPAQQPVVHQPIIQQVRQPAQVKLFHTLSKSCTINSPFCDYLEVQNTQIMVQTSELQEYLSNVSI